MKKRILDDCLRLAKILVHKHTEHFRHYSFIIQKNQIIKFGINKSIIPPVYFGFKEYSKLHSEFMAYKAAKGLLDKSKPFEVVNIRLSKKNETKISKPCPTCQAWLKQLNCSHIWYTTSEETFEKF